MSEAFFSKNPTVSVMVPVYNVEKFLPKTIESIINQSYKNLEIILVDDGSTDSSGAICDEYAAKDNRIKVIHKENGGVSTARNAALDIATGEFYGFVDGDDYIDHTFFEKALAALIKDNADIVEINVNYVSEIGETVKPKWPYHNYTKQITGRQAIPTLYKFMMAYIWSKVYRAYLFKDVRFPEDRRISEDHFVLSRVVIKAKLITYINEKLCNYVQRSNSITNIAPPHYDTSEAYFDRAIVMKNEHLESHLVVNEILRAIHTLDTTYDKIEKTKGNIAKYKELYRLYTTELRRVDITCFKNLYFSKFKAFIKKHFPRAFAFLKKVKNILTRKKKVIKISKTPPDNLQIGENAIAVIVPCYKVARFLRKTVNSILSQTFTNFILVLVNDGSPDNCGAICDEYARKDSRIAVIHKKNGGVSSALNAGLDYCLKTKLSEKIKYLAFIDGDDWVNTDFLEKLHSKITEHNADMAMCDYTYVNENGQRLENKNYRLTFPDGTMNNVEAMHHMRKNWKWILRWNKLYSKHIFSDLRIKKYRLHQDEAMALDIIHRAKKTALLSEPLYNYVQYSTSSIKTETHKTRYDFLVIALNRYLFYIKHGYFITDIGYLQDYSFKHYFDNLASYVKECGVKEKIQLYLFATRLTLKYHYVRRKYANFLYKNREKTDFTSEKRKAFLTLKA